MLIDPPAVPVRLVFETQLPRHPYTSIDLPCIGIVLFVSAWDEIETDREKGTHEND